MLGAEWNRNKAHSPVVGSDVAAADTAGLAAACACEPDTHGSVRTWADCDIGRVSPTDDSTGAH